MGCNISKINKDNFSENIIRDYFPEDKNIFKVKKNFSFGKNRGVSLWKGDYVIAEDYNQFGIGGIDIRNEMISIKKIYRDFSDGSWKKSSSFLVIPREILKPI